MDPWLQGLTDTDRYVFTNTLARWSVDHTLRNLGVELASRQELTHCLEREPRFIMRFLVPGAGQNASMVLTHLTSQGDKPYRDAAALSPLKSHDLEKRKVTSRLSWGQNWD